MHLKTSTLSFALLVLAGLSCAHAARPASMQFTHLAWDLACDNTRTCRAAGYYDEVGSDEDNASGRAPLPVSVLLTREAGPHTPIQGEVQLDEETMVNWARELSLTLRIDGKPSGTVVLDHRTGTFPLPQQQTILLVLALTRNSQIAWSDGRRSWKLSDAGAAAVLLKMDEFQGRLGTPGSVMRKGTRDENTVLPPLPVPVIQAAAVPPGGPISLPASERASLRSALAASTKECSTLEQGQPPGEMTVHRLSATKLLVSTVCWVTAYNEGEGYWVVNAKAPYAPRMVTPHASGYADGAISASHKLDSLGDCAEIEKWVWNGRRFVHASQGTTGQCMPLVVGGAWSLPVLVTTVRPAARP
ncbi:DUF1176 domain-containing protein [Massilia sp. Dwa41.01b]|nr:DUF1176 domain-containing protein [Massilia sp. Dwa41.01b]QNB01531.1 DUF1176 domain-containing protein [Massilia sp. Se16.2.3]